MLTHARRDENVYRRFEKHNYVLSFIHNHGIYIYIVFFTVNSSINAAGDHLAGGSFMEKAVNERLFPELRIQSLWCSD